MPARDPHRAIDRNLILKASKKASRSSEEDALREFESLNAFFGWDLRKGFTEPEKLEQSQQDGA